MRRDLPIVLASALACASSAQPDCRVAEVAIVADYEFTQAHFGGDAAAAREYLTDLVAAISPIFERDAGVRLQASLVHAWDQEPDPFTDSDPQARSAIDGVRHRLDKATSST